MKFALSYVIEVNKFIDMKSVLIKVKKIRELSVLMFYFVVISHLNISNVQAKEYIIGVENISYYPLYDFTENSANKNSFTQELLSTFFTRQGYQFKFISLPVKRFDRWYVEETIDFKFPDNERWRTGESKKLNVTYSQPVLKLTAGTYVLQKHQDKTTEAIKRLGTILGFYPTLWHESILDNSVKLVEATSPYSLVKHLLHGNIDGVNIDKNVITHNLKALQVNENQVVLNENITHETYAYYFSTIAHTQVIKEFNHFLNSNGQLIAKLKLKYGIIDPPK